MNLHWMALSCLLVASIGYMMGKHRDVVLLGVFAILTGTVLIMARGYYWNIFGRGTGFFTANRVSALVMLYICANYAFWAGSRARAALDRLELLADAIWQRKLAGEGENQQGVPTPYTIQYPLDDRPWPKKDGIE